MNLLNTGYSSRHFMGDVLKNSKPQFKLLFVFILLFICYLIVTFLSMLFALPLFNLTWTELSTLLTSGMLEADIAILKYFQITQTIGLFLVPAILLNYLIFTHNERFLHASKVKQAGLLLTITFFSLIVSIPLVSKLIEWNTSFQFPAWAGELEALIKRMEEERNELTVRMLEGRAFRDLLINLFIIAVLPALSEEFIFRGVLQKLLSGWFRNTHLAIFISALLFSAIHFQFYGFVPRLLLGLYFGYLFYWSRNIWFAVWAHFTNNATAVLLLFVGKAEKPFMPEIFREEFSPNTWQVLISFCLTLLLISFLWSMLHRKSEWPHKSRELEIE